MNRSAISRIVGRPLLSSACAAYILVVLVVCLTSSPALGQSRFTRGDSNDDGRLDVSDSVCVLTFLFLAGDSRCARPGCMDALDANDDGDVDIADATRLLAYLFQSGAAPAEPFATRCGDDPSPEDELNCNESAACRDVDPTFRLVVPSEPIVLESMWTDGLSMLAEAHAVHSEIVLRQGEHSVARGADLDPVFLIDIVRVGSDWAEAVTTGPGSIRFEAPSTYVYSESFEFAGGMLTARLAFRVDDEDDELVLDCDTLSACGGIEAVYETPKGKRPLFYSCFCPSRWSVSPVPYASPLYIALEDGARLVVHTEDCDCGIGVGDETVNRRLARAQVDLRDVLLDLDEHRYLVIAASSENQRQELRIVFDAPIDEVFGIDLIECPGPSGPSCGLTVLDSRVYYLDENLERIQEVLIQDFNQGGSED